MIYNTIKLKWESDKSIITCKALMEESNYHIAIQVGRIPLASTLHVDLLEADALREMLEEVHTAHVNQSRSTGEQVKKHGLSKMQAKRK
tara:strand:+ start:1427 stop:1693 length:267 start_codon:yes stop_codon:yes gene_type:complete